MLLTIHDAHLKKVAFIDNEKQGTLSFYDDTWTRNLQTGSSTYEFSISKKTLVSDTVFDRTYSYLNERAFVSFEYKGETFLFNVMTVEEDEKKIKCYCENLNLELINEYSNPFKADRAMSFVEYCNAMDLLNMTKLSVGINEVSDYKRTLEWEGQDTKLARLISLANKFDAEIEFKTYLNDDSTIKQFLVNVYHENDGMNYHGVGRDRKDITLVYGKNIKSIRRKIDKTNIFNMIVPTAQSEENSDQKLTIGSLPNWELKNDKGVVEFYKRGDALYAPISAQLYPSTFTSETQSDQWTRRDMDFNVKSIQQLETEGLKQLKASAYPELTYEFDGYIDADIGDTVELSDSGFANTLLIEARIFEQKLSFSTRKNWKTTLGNFRALQSKLSNDIQSELERLVEDAKPYNIRISTDNGTMFKNNEGESLVKATLWKGGKIVSRDVSWRWALDGNVTVATQCLVKAKDIDETAVLTVSAYIGNNEVATTEITLTNVNDGSNGDDGVGIDYVSNYYLATAQLNSIEPLGDNLLVNADTFNDWISVSGGDGTATVISVDEAPLEEVTKAIRVVDNTIGNKDLRYKNFLSLEVGKQYTISCFARVASDSPKSSVTLLMRSWTTNDTNRKLSTAITHTDWQFYSFTFTADAVSNFIQFGQNGAGIIEICAPRLVKNQQSYGWTSSTQLITEAQRYLWHYRVEHYTDNTEKATAPAIIGVYGNRGKSGKDGVAGKDGVGLKSTAVTYGLSTSETTQPTSWSAQVPTLTKGKYLWTKTVWTYTDNTSETGYQKTYIAKDGNDGSDGIAGKDGVGIKSTAITYASSTSGTTKPTSGWSSTIPSVSAGNYLWTRTIWTYTDNTSETGYSVAKMGETGAKGDKGDSGADGVGIKSSAVTYAVSTSGTTPPTSWQSTIPSVPAGSYLWARTVLTLTDGKTQTSYAVGMMGLQGIQGAKGDKGIQGEKGADGKTQYTHIAYADSATGGGFSQTDQTKAYIGMYQDFTATDSTDPTKYRWTKWKGSDGAQGIPGKAGADGKTPYIHFAYANSADGKTGFSLTDGNQRYMGYYSDYTQADSSDYTKYKWVDRLANVLINVRNYAEDYLFSRGIWKYTQGGGTKSYTLSDGVYRVTGDTTDWKQLQIYSKTGTRANDETNSTALAELKAGEKYTLSFQARCISGDNEAWVSLRENRTVSTGGNPDRIKTTVNLTEDWETYQVTVDSLAISEEFDYWRIILGYNKIGTVEFRQIELTNSSMHIGAGAAPEDTQAQIDSKADSVLTQEQLNALAEKNRTLEAELEAKAALATVEAWKEAYDNYVNQNEVDKAVSEANLVTATNRITALAEDWQDKKVSWSFLDTHMDFQNEGLILGKKGSPTTIRISNDRIAFYSGGTEVASMSEGTLTIDNGIFAKSLQIGHFREEVYESDSSINVIRWVD